MRSHTDARMRSMQQGILFASFQYLRKPRHCLKISILLRRPARLKPCTIFQNQSQSPALTRPEKPELDWQLSTEHLTQQFGYIFRELPHDLAIKFSNSLKVSITCVI